MTQLLDILRRRASHRGLVIVRGETLQREVHASQRELAHALGVLERERQLRVLSPLPYLVVALPERMWPSEQLDPSKSGPLSGPALARGYSYSFHKHSSNQRKAIAIEDGGAGEGGRLLQEVLATLGESDPVPFRGVIEHFPAERIRAALARVRATPPERLRKSRTALFRYLLTMSK